MSNFLHNKFSEKDFTEYVSSNLPDFQSTDSRVETRRGFSAIKQIGESPQLDLVIFATKPDSSIHARMEVSKQSYALLKNHPRAHALVAYHSDEADEWRLSLITTQVTRDKEGIKETVSNPRRYSYVLGPKAKVNTPTKYLITKGKIADLDDLKKRFSLEVVNQDFYKEISNLFVKLTGGTVTTGRNKMEYKALLQLPSVPEKDQKNLEFAVRLIGRVIFCWFLCEKKSVAGSSLMPKELLSLHAVGEHVDYYHSILEPIFFEVLNKHIKSRKDLYTNDLFSSIPYLNGGLFAPDHDDYFSYNVEKQAIFHNVVTVPDDWIKEFLGFLETYNFTIDENVSFDEELSIDPEMLGRIFENLLAEINPDTGESARKKTGSYYTPRTIVDYMVDESLLVYLKERTSIDESKLRAIISYDLEDDVTHPLTIDEYNNVIDSLSTVKILDPACGSGAFPIGALQKIVFILQQVDPDGHKWFEKQMLNTAPEIRRVIEREFASKNFNYIRKLGVIRENIFGVDIQPIATEISRLRCFLTLIVDQSIHDDMENRGIEPLPNLDFKFVTANTLNQLPGGLEPSLFKDKERIDQLKDLRNQFFSSTNSERQRLQLEFKELQNQMLDHMIEMKGGDEITRTLSTWNPFSHKGSSWFDLEWMFGIEGGFDIVIANPPYISVEKFARTPMQAEWKKNFKTYAARCDIYCFFYERGLTLLRDGGVLTYISSNKFQRAGYGKKLRQLLASQKVHTLIDFCELPVFEAATDPMIVIVKKDPASPSDEFSVLVVKDENELGFLQQSIDSRASYYKSEQLKVEGWSLEGVHGLKLVEKLQANGTPLNDYVSGRFYYGIKTGLNEAFIIDHATRERLIHEDQNSAELIKPWIRGRDIKRWTHEFHDMYVIIVRHGFKDQLKNYPAILKHLSKFESKLKERGQCKTSRSGSGEGQHHWLELDNNPSESYIAAFDEPKIVFNETSKRLHAYLDDEGNAINKTGFIILTPEAPYVLAVLNSKPMDWLYRSTFPSWGDPWSSGRVQFRGDRMNKVPIPFASSTDKSHLTKLVEEAAKLSKSGDATGLAVVEKEIDAIVYRLFDLTPEEVEVIENNQP
jgi:hypothetical protein